ncbi:MAG: thiamine pyrophosphate-binding protein, partial [Actinobacteria bacterium]|nr:thiamine pyrophosphate-binding protein [Actinomycetota bacterium]
TLWKRKYPICPPNYYKEEKVNPYVFVKILSQLSKEGDNIVVDTGCCLAWMMQGFDFKKNQRLYHDWNNTAMGWALPASIGVSFAKNKSPVICVTGDGSLQMNIQELATIMRYELPIKIFLLNNKGFSMIRQTQDQWLNSHYVASSIKGGLPDLNYSKIAKAYGFYTIDISKNNNIKKYIQKTFKSKSPVFCNVKISPNHRVIPQVKYGKPNEDPEPLLDREDFFKDMIVPPMDSLMNRQKTKK